MTTLSLQQWFTSPLGEYLFTRERAWLDEVVPDIFGYHAIQLGLPVTDLLRGSRIAHRLTVAPEATANVQAEFAALPFEAQSIDLCILPHVLEFAENPHEILREVDRVMRPEGRILIIGFNPWSLFGVKKLWSAREMPWSGQFVSLVRMKDWLQLLGFEPASGRLACYIPPCQTPQWQQRWAMAERLGERWWGVAGAVYMLEAIKRVQGVHLITPAWSRDTLPERKFAAARKHGVAAVSTPPAPHLTLIK